MYVITTQTSDEPKCFSPVGIFPTRLTAQRVAEDLCNKSKMDHLIYYIPVARVDYRPRLVGVAIWLPIANKVALSTSEQDPRDDPYSEHPTQADIFLDRLAMEDPMALDALQDILSGRRF